MILKRICAGSCVIHNAGRPDAKDRHLAERLPSHEGPFETINLNGQHGRGGHSNCAKCRSISRRPELGSTICMSDGEPRSEILRLEVEIEELAEVIERRRKIILFSKIAVAAGGIWLLALTIGIMRFDPVAMISAIAVVIGGTVVFGSNTSRAKQTAAALKAGEALRAELIGKMNLTVVREQRRADICNAITMPRIWESRMNDEQELSLAWTVGVLKGLLTGEDADSRERGYGRALTDAIERLSGNTRDQNECNLTWTINSLRERIESMGGPNSTQSGIGAALMDAVEQLEKLESNFSA
jgi:hypothetical protein